MSALQHAVRPPLLATVVIRPPHPGQQQGMALVMGLVFLVLLTILGVSVMNTTLLGSRMAVNSQEMNRALYASESGLEQGFTNANTYVGLAKEGDTTNESITIDGSTVTLQTVFLVKGNKVPRTDKLSAVSDITKFRTANFEQTSRAATTTSATAEIRQGITQVIPKE